MGSSKPQTVGYTYCMGLHIGICHEADALVEIRVGDRPAWGGLVTENRRFWISAANLFGGQEREGGIQGYVDVMMGRPDQMPNAYLGGQHGAIQPAYRGFTGIVFNGPSGGTLSVGDGSFTTRYVPGIVSANNPYLKAWSFRVRSILRGWHEDRPWYPERATVGYGGLSSAAIYFALDLSGSMDTITPNGKTRLENMKAAVVGVLDFLEANGSIAGVATDVCIVSFGTTPSSRTSFTRRNIDALGIAQLRAHVNSLTTIYWTYFPAAFLDLAEFMEGASPGASRTVFFVTDGEPSTGGAQEPLEKIAADARALVDAVPGVRVHGINIDLADTQYTAMVDNTPEDGVPVIEGDNPEAMTSVVVNVLASRFAMNPVHIIVQALTDPDWGMGYPIATIDQASFRVAADRLAAEGLGLSFKWNTQATIQEFTQIVADHAGLVYGQDRRTGLFRMRLLRADYDIEDLPVFGRDDVKVVRYQRPSLADTVNEVIIQYTDGMTGKEAATPPLQNLANIQGQGRVVSQSLNFPGVMTLAMAVRVGMRELQARSTPLWRFSIEAKRRFSTLLPGEPFVLDLLDTDIGVRLVMRAGDIDYGQSSESAVRAECVEDVFAMPETTYVGDPGTGGEPPDVTPRLGPAMSFEVPYVELVQTIPDSELQSLPVGSGFVAAVALRPSGVPLNYALYTSTAGGGLIEAATGDYAPGAVLAQPALAESGPTVLFLASASQLGSLPEGSGAFLGSTQAAEIVRIDSIDTDAMTVTVARGCADTVPQEWPAGTRLWGYDTEAAADPQRYSAGEIVQTAVVNRTPSGEIPLESATQGQVELNARAARPYAPAGVKLNGIEFPEETSTDLLFTWSHRDRVLQADTLVGWHEASIGPEPGTTYTVQLWSESGTTMVGEWAGIDGASLSIPIADLADMSAIVRVFSVREGLSSYQRAEWTMNIESGTLAMLVFPLTYDERDGEHAIQLERHGGAGPHITPRGFVGDGYEARYKTDQIPPWLNGGAFTLQASVSASPLRIRSARDELVSLCSNNGAANVRLGFAVRTDERGDTLAPAGAIMLSSGANRCFVGRPGWRYEFRTPSPMVGAYNAKPQAVHFLDADTLLMSVHLDDTESLVYRVRLSDGAITGQFTFGTTTYRHVASIAARQNGEVWAGDYETGTLIRLDLDASFASGSAVILATCASNNLGNGVGAITFHVIGGVEYLIQATYDTLDTGGFIYLFPASVLASGAILVSDRFKRFVIGRRVQGVTIRSGRLLVSRNNKVNASSPGGTVGWLTEYDIDAMAANLPDGASGVATYMLREAVGPSSYVEDVSIQPGTGRVFVGTEGGYSVADAPGFMGVWSGTLDPYASESNTYTAFFDGDSQVTVKVNGYLFATLPWVVDQPAQVLTIGGLPVAAPGYGTGHTLATISNVALANGELADSQARQIAAGSYEPLALDAYEIPLTNPGAEAGNTSGWTTELGGMVVRSANPLPYAGGFYFSGGNFPQSRNRQRVSMGSVPAASIDAGVAWARIQWQQSAYSAEDPGTMGIRTLTAADGEIGTSYAGNAWTPFGGGAGGPWYWYPRSHPVLLPASARKLDALYFGTRSTGTSQDHYVDDVSLTVYVQGGTEKTG